MPQVSFAGTVDAREVCTTVAVMDQASPHTCGGSDPLLTNTLPPVALRIGVIENATMFVERGHDGVLIDNAGRAVKETGLFSNIGRERREAGILSTDADERHIESLFVSFDAAWFNYYHWLSFAIAPAALAACMLDKIPIAVPDYYDRARLHPPSFSSTVYEQSLQMAVPKGEVIRLKRGVYRVGRAYMMYVDGGETNLFTIHSRLTTGLRRMVKPSDRTGGRIFISRLQQGANGRLTAAEDCLFERLSRSRGFKKIFLENLPFVDQVQLFSESDVILAPHGSGLANAFFSRQGTVIVELTRAIDGDGRLRSWFQLLAKGSGLVYRCLNGDTDDFTELKINECFDSLGL